MRIPEANSIGVALFATMVLAAAVMDLASAALDFVPGHQEDMRAHITHVALNYTCWLFGAVAMYLFAVDRRHPMNHRHHDHHAMQVTAPERLSIMPMSEAGPRTSGMDVNLEG